MLTNELYLVRHAHASGAEEADPSLSELGTSQATAMGARLALCGVVTILHGPRRRAQETAELIARSVPDVAVRMSHLPDDQTPVPSPQNRWAYPKKYWDWLAATPPNEQDIDGIHITQAA